MNFIIAHWKQYPLWIRDLIAALIAALLFSAFIYFEHFNISYQLINSFNALTALVLLLILSKRAILMSGFFIGLLWFYWIGFSFQYYNMAWMTPLVTLGFGLVYLLFFGTLAFTHRIYLRAIILFTLTFIAPFYFNWMQIELLFINSYFGVEKWQFALILMALTLTLSLKKPYRYLMPLLLLTAINYTPFTPPHVPIKMKLVATDLPQELKWLPQMRQKIITENLKQIDKAINEGYELVVLPESAFAMFLNHYPYVITQLQSRSYKITILTGALFEEKAHNYNVSYLFNHGDIQVAKKMVLVPFGEYIPLPKFMRRTINETFFNGASDYLSADKPTDFKINGLTLRNAICYEATTPEIYQDNPEFVIAMSNNAWFMPSIEPTLQKLLIRYYAKKHGSRVYHVTNASGSYTIP